MTRKTDRKGIVTTYSYDIHDRLISEAAGTEIRTYTYDGAGNRSSEAVTVSSMVTTTTYAYNNENRLTMTTKTVGGVNTVTKFFYDQNGNTTRQRIDTNIVDFTYDNRNQMISADDPKGIGAGAAYTAANTYNPEGIRIKKAVTQANVTETTGYVYEYSHIVLEMDNAGKEKGFNIYAGDMLMSRKTGGTVLYYLYNGHGDVTALVDAIGIINTSYYYDAFGNILEETGGAFAFGNSYRYSGYQYDKESDLYYLNARDYSAKIARFMSQDTYTGQYDDPLSLNLYTYVSNNPLRYRDPSGHCQKGDEG